jgi:ABC-2 type transport system permease protein
MPDPIADLSYRTYRGEHLAEKGRWLIIAKMGWRTAFKKRSYWVLSALASWYYLITIAIVFFIEQRGIAKQAPEFVEQIFGRFVWKDQFLTGFNWTQLIWLVIGLMVGIGSIANDNGTNALLVYLSKPCRKIDYLVGKWMGVFVPLLVAVAVPNVFFFVYGVLNFREYGFLSQDPWLGPKLVLLYTCVAAFQTSLLIGVSSLFNKGRMAGLAVAGAYFMLTFFSMLMLAAWIVSIDGPPRRRNQQLGQTASKLFYLSIDGMQVGLAKNILDTDGSTPFGADSGSPQIAKPPAGLVVIPMVLLSAGGVLLAWKRIRAVEVVK